MTKKEQQRYLLNQIDAAKCKMNGDYTEADGFTTFTLPGTTTIWRIKTTIDPEEFRRQRLEEFRVKVAQPANFRAEKLK